MIRGELIKDIRENVLKISAAEACEKIGINPITYRKLEQRPQDIKQFDICLLEKIANFYQISLDALFGRCFGNQGIYYPSIKAIVSESYDMYLFKHRNVPKVADEPVYVAPWPYNLLDAIEVNIPEEERVEVPMSEDSFNGLKYIVNNKLNERESKAIRLYYYAEKTLAEIGKELDVTPERVRQILAKAVRKLRHPSRYCYITKGLSVVLNQTASERLDVEARLITMQIEHKMKEIKYLKASDEFLDAYMNFHNETVGFSEFLKTKENTKIDEDVRYTNINDLRLSVRTYNALRRCGITDVDDIIKYHENNIENGGLMKIRNLGTKSFLEVKDKMTELGLELKEMKEELTQTECG